MSTYALPDSPDGLNPQEALDLALSLLEWAKGEGAGDPTRLRLAFPVVTTSVKDGSVVSTLTEVTIRRPKVGDLTHTSVASAKTEMALGIALAKRLTGLPDHLFDKIDGVDFERIGQVIAGFQRHSPVTGSSAE